MAVRTITSDPKPSAKHTGYFYAYYNQATRNGGEATVIFPPVIKDIVRRGFSFDDSIIRFDEALKASVLELDFDAPQNEDDPSLPPDRENGWCDPDYLPATPADSSEPPAFPPRAGLRPPAVRKQMMARVTQENAQLRSQVAAGADLPPALRTIASEVAQCFLYQYQLLGSVADTRRGDIAQKLTAIACIPYYRNVGVTLTDDDVKAMTF